MYVVVCVGGVVVVKAKKGFGPVLVFVELFKI
jgi:hypothetical protein